MQAINYAGDENLNLPEDAQFVGGVSGNALYLPAGKAFVNLKDDRSAMSVSVWRKWDGVVEQDFVRGVFEIKNIKVCFSSKDDFLTLELPGHGAVKTSISDSQEWHHWCFLFEKKKSFTIFKDGEQIFNTMIGDYFADFSEGLTLGGGRTHACFDELRAYNYFLEDSEVSGLFRLISKGTQLDQVEKVVEQTTHLTTPHYIGTVTTAPEGRRVKIKNGKQNGFNECNISDWVLVTEAITGFKKGWCYRWDGSRWQILDPPESYTEEYMACLKDQLQLTDLFQDSKFFGTVICQYLGFNEAVGKSLTANNAFLDELVTKRLLVDNDTNDESDFELSINRDVGILAKNNGEKIFEIAPFGKSFFSGDIITPSFELTQGNIESKSFSYNNELIVNIVKNNVFQGSNPLPVHGTYICSGSYDGKTIIKISNTVEIIRKGFSHVVVDKSVDVKNWGVRYILHYADALIELYKFSLILFFSNDSQKKLEDEIYKSTISTDSESSVQVEKDVFEDTDRISTKFAFPKTKVTNLTVEWNKTKTTMKVKDLPVGIDDYPTGVVYIEDGFLKIKE